MGTSLQRNTNRSRPTKSAAAKNQRQKVQSRRLVALGMSEAAVAELNSSEIRTLLKHPKKVSDANKG
ncbi:hypothetical protein OAI07_00235 [Akkermansiaceae bacterium]|nr:hypothetical protein [Akkermansiaceae bacterium]